MRRVYAKVFTLGTALGTLGGALVIPATAAMSEMGIELIVEAFALGDYALGLLKGNRLTAKTRNFASLPFDKVALFYIDLYVIVRIGQVIVNSVKVPG